MQLLVRQLCTLVCLKPKKTACHIMQKRFTIGDTFSIQHHCITIWHLPFNFQVKPSQHFSESPSCSQTGHAFVDKGFHGRTLRQGGHLSRMEIGWGTKWKATEVETSKVGNQTRVVTKEKLDTRRLSRCFNPFLHPFSASIFEHGAETLRMVHRFFVLARAEESSSIVWRIQFPSDQLPKWLEKVAGRDVSCPSCQ